MTSRAPSVPQLRVGARALLLVAGLLGSTALFYLLRGGGLSLQAALVVTATVSALPTLVRLARGHRPHGLEAFFTALLMAAVAVALVPGSERFLLAKESVLTGATGAWFLLSVRADRPLAYQLSRPLAEGRLGWPRDWEQLWAASPQFRRMWRRSSIAWGVATLTDATARVVLVLTLTPEAVPALSLALVLATVVVLNVATTAYYARCGAFDRGGPFHAGATAAAAVERR